MGKTAITLALSVFLICFTHSAFSATPDFPKCPPYADVAWEGKNYDQVLETLMPNNIESTVGKDEWILSVRISPSFSAELQFTLNKYSDGKVIGKAISPSKGSLGDQLTLLKETHPEKELNELINMIELDHWQITFDSNKELENKIRFLQEYTLIPESRNFYCLDGIGYEILLQTPTKKVNFSFGCNTKRSADLIGVVKAFGDHIYGYRKIDYDLLDALETKDIKTAIQLIQSGANPALQTIEGDRSSWMNSLGLHNADLINLILEKQPELIHKDKPVHTAALNGSAEIIPTLLQAGADINEEVRGETPLAAAANYEEMTLDFLNRKSNDFESITNELVKAGADLDKKRDDGMTALMLAISNRHEAIAATLIDAGAELNTVDNCGDTALILAAKYGLKSTIEKLLRAGADDKFVNAYGKTAADYARENGFKELIEFFQLVTKRWNCSDGIRQN